MAGGINLPQGIGVGPITGSMTFAPTQMDPFTTMLRAYGLGMQGRGQGIENALSAAELPYAGEKARLGMDKLQAEIANMPADREYKRALTERIGLENSNPLLGSSGIAGQIAAYNQAVKMGDPNAPLILENLKRDATGQTTNAQTWRSLPMDLKLETIGSARAMGIDPIEAATKLSQGVTLEELAIERGLNPADIYAKSPVYPPTGATRSRVQRREGAEAELDVIANFVTDSIEPYVTLGSINSYSPKMIVDQLKGANEDQQADFLAAYALYPEENYIRLQLAQGEGGITALEHMEDRALGNIKVFTPLVNKKVWGKAQRRINEKLKEGSRAYTNTVKNPGMSAQKSQMVGSMTTNLRPVNEMTEEEVDAELNGMGG